MALSLSYIAETLATSAAASLIDPVYFVVYLAAGILIRKFWWAVAAGLAWPVLIEAGAWIIYPGESLPWGHVGPIIGGPIATAVIWWIRNLFRKKTNGAANG